MATAVTEEVADNPRFKLIPIMTRFFIPLLIGAALDSLMGYFGQCNSGTCPLTSTWWRGAIYGGVLGLLFAMNSRP